MLFFSSRRRHTRYWRDWSSDVCSSDLLSSGTATGTGVQTQMTMYDALGTAHQISLSFSKTGDNAWNVVARDENDNVLASTAGPLAFDPVAGTLPPEIGRASCRERV